MKPTVGRIVHYYGSRTQEKPLAALVLAVHDAHGPSVDLAVFPVRKTVDLASFETGRAAVLLVCGVEQLGVAPDDAPFWCWPPREEVR